MSLFIEPRIDPALAADLESVKKLVEVCPVDIFAAGDNSSLEIVEANVDECTLCELCLAVGEPGQVRILKLYEDGKALERSA